MNANQTNQFGLKRTIPPQVKQDVRKRSKYGCVVCRCGIYQYEHIEPEFKDARKHDAERICCLCGRCHDKVTRGLLSKDAVWSAYRNVQNSDSVDRPREFFDFHTGDAKLALGGLTCNPTPKSVFRYEGINLFSVKPGETNGEPGAVYASFCDDECREQFSIQGNEWVGPTSIYDFEIIGQQLELHAARQRILFRLRHIPPGLVIIERLDMRYKDVHILASEHDFAIGRYTKHDDNLIWLHTKSRIDQIFSNPIAVDIDRPRAFPEEYQQGLSAKRCGFMMNQSGKVEQVIATDARLPKVHNPLACGIHWPGLGFQVAKGCEFAFSALEIGVCSIHHARNHFFMKNRMNVPSLYLPAVINAVNLRIETERVAALGETEAKAYLSEPFLVLKDAAATDAWEHRNAAKAPGERLANTPFYDDKPGCYGAYGAIKLVDAYDGPACRVKRGAPF